MPMITNIALILLVAVLLFCLWNWRDHVGYERRMHGHLRRMSPKPNRVGR